MHRTSKYVQYCPNILVHPSFLYVLLLRIKTFFHFSKWSWAILYLAFWGPFSVVGFFFVLCCFVCVFISAAFSLHFIPFINQWTINQGGLNRKQAFLLSWWKYYRQRRKFKTWIGTSKNLNCEWHYENRSRETWRRLLGTWQMHKENATDHVTEQKGRQGQHKHRKVIGEVETAENKVEINQE